MRWRILLFICCGHLDESLALANVLVLSILMLWPSALQCFDGRGSCTWRVSPKPAVRWLSIDSLRSCAMACVKDRDLMTETHFSGAPQEFKKGFLKVAKWGLEFIPILLLKVAWPYFIYSSWASEGLWLHWEHSFLWYGLFHHVRSLVGKYKKNQYWYIKYILKKGSKV